MKIMLQNLRDLIPKVIGQILVNKSMDNLQLEIIDGINKSNEVLECLSEVSQGLVNRSRSTSEWKGKQCRRRRKF